jgi:hypothetical protein
MKTTLLAMTGSTWRRFAGLRHIDHGVNAASEDVVSAEM